MAGLSNHGRTGSKPYVPAGTRTYVIGTQDGAFPDLGEHLPGEMGGVWLHPIKLIDGFQATLSEPASGRQAALSTAADFITYPYGNRFHYGPVLDSLRSSASSSVRTAKPASSSSTSSETARAERAR
jgi:hypothetical protein